MAVAGEPELNVAVNVSVRRLEPSSYALPTSMGSAGRFAPVVVIWTVTAKLPPGMIVAGSVVEV